MDEQPGTKVQRWRPVPSSWLAAQARERDYLRREFGQVRDLIPTLMKHRNGKSWAPEERQLLMWQLRSLAHLEFLDITNTPLIDARRIDLSGCKSLKELSAYNFDEAKILVPEGCVVITFD